jgi:hypothetical protein
MDGPEFTPSIHVRLILGSVYGSGLFSYWLGAKCSTFAHLARDVSHVKTNLI